MWGRVISPAVASSKAQGQRSWSVSGKTSSAWSSDINTHGSHDTPMVTQTVDIITDPSCSRNMDQIYSSSATQAWTLPRTQAAAQVTQSSMAPVAAWSSDLHLTSDDIPDPGYLHGLWEYREPWISAQTLATVEKGTQTWSYASAHAQMSPRGSTGHPD